MTWMCATRAGPAALMDLAAVRRGQTARAAEGHRGRCMGTRRRLDAELVRRGLARSREQAADLVTDRRVLVAGQAAAKPATQVTPDDPITVTERLRQPLMHVLEHSRVLGDRQFRQVSEPGHGFIHPGVAGRRPHRCRSKGLMARDPLVFHRSRSPSPLRGKHRF